MICVLSIFIISHALLPLSSLYTNFTNRDKREFVCVFKHENQKRDVHVVKKRYS